MNHYKIEMTLWGICIASKYFTHELSCLFILKKEIIGFNSGYVLNFNQIDNEQKYLFIQDVNIRRWLDEDKVDRTKEVKLDPVTGLE